VRALLLIIACVACLPACEDSVDDLSCAQLRAEFTRATMDRGSCESDADCTLTGGSAYLPPASHAECGCAPALGGEEIGIARNAPELERAQAITRSFVARCALDRDQLCDGRLITGVSCAAHRCESTGPNCNQP